MIEKLKAFLLKNNILNNDTTFVVGFSGGFDSCALLHMLSTLQKDYSFKLCAAHLNHGWRADASDNDELNCKKFCTQYGIELYSEKLNNEIPQTETAAREARYEFFERAAKYFNTNIVFTAHTKSDNVETILYRIAKGTGIYGLCGIDEIRKINNILVLRPLLFAERINIEEYCKQYGLTPNNDLSNFDTKYNRNFIRHEIYPALLKINQNLCSAINNLSKNAIADEEIINEYLGIVKKKITDNDKFKTQEFLKLSASLQKRVIYNFVLENNFDYDRKKILEIFEFIKNASSSKAGKTLSLTANLWLYCSHKEFYTIRKAQENKHLQVLQINDKNKQYKFDNYIFTIEPFSTNPLYYPKENENYAIVDLSSENTLLLRNRINGDRIQPFGFNKTIKLKKFFINKNIPQHQKDKVVLLCNQDEVLWACGVGISEKIRVKTIPTHRIRIEEV